MAKVKCEYCGNFINDTMDTCPRCGAINNAYKRHAETTPQTIDELKKWYIAQNLPPEETTRCFIGKNIKTPRAYGIYEENGEFIVYKNKFDGSRVVRYQGTDETYAVNELYINLKEETSHQKLLNAAKIRLIDAVTEKLEQINNQTNTKTNNQTTTNKPDYTNKNFNNKIKLLGMIVPFIMFLVVIPNMLQLFSTPIITPNNFNDNSSHTSNGFNGLFSIMSDGFYDDFYDDFYDKFPNTTNLYDDILSYLGPPSQCYYISDTNDIYYCEGYDEKNKGYDWWKYDVSNNEWSFYTTLANNTTYPEGIIDNSDYYNIYDLVKQTSIPYRDINIYYSKTFVDDGHHLTPNTSYYYYDDNLYYFLNDEHGEDYGVDNTGWYIFKDNQWQMFCKKTDKAKLSEDLWYYADNYSAGDDYNSLDMYVDDPSIYTAKFEDTDWYKSYQQNERIYQNNKKEN